MIVTEELVDLLTGEGLIPIAELMEHSTPSTLSRWIHHGVHGIRLEAICQGGRWLSSRAAVARFRARCTGAMLRTPEPAETAAGKRAETAQEKRKRIRKGLS